MRIRNLRFKQKTANKNIITLAKYLYKNGMSSIGHYCKYYTADHWPQYVGIIAREEETCRARVEQANQCLQTARTTIKQYTDTCLPAARAVKSNPLKPISRHSRGTEYVFIDLVLDTSFHLYLKSLLGFIQHHYELKDRDIAAKLSQLLCSDFSDLMTMRIAPLAIMNKGVHTPLPYVINFGHIKYYTALSDLQTLYPIIYKDLQVKPVAGMTLLEQLLAYASQPNNFIRHLLSSMPAESSPYEYGNLSMFLWHICNQSYRLAPALHSMDAKPASTVQDVQILYCALQLGDRPTSLCDTLCPPYGYSKKKSLYDSLSERVSSPSADEL